MSARFRLGYNRTMGAARMLRERAVNARDAADRASDAGFLHFAASLRGKAMAYDESAAVIEALHRDRRLPRRKRWEK